MRERGVLWVVLAAFVVGLIAVGALAAVDDNSSGTPPRLPALSLAGAGGRSAATSDLAMPIGSIEYRVAGTLPSLADHARAWDVGNSVTIDDVRHLASTLGVDGDVKADDSGWSVTGGDRQLRVERFAGAPWSFGAVVDCGGPDTAVSSDGATTSSGCAVAGSGGASAGASTPYTGTATMNEPPTSVDGSCVGGQPVGGTGAQPVPDCPPVTATTVAESCPMPDCPPGTACAQVCPEPTPEPMPMPEPQRPADLPSKAEAERIGRALLTKAGLDLDGADVRVDDGFSQWIVTADPRVGDLPTQGFAWSASVGPKGAIENANGWLADPTEGDDYPLAGIDKGVERLKNGDGGWSPYPRPLMATDMPTCVDCPTTTRTITGVRLGLLFAPVFDSNGTSDRALLVPAYFFHFDDTDYEQPVIAVADEFLPKPPAVEPHPKPEPAPAPSEPGGGANESSCSGGGSSDGLTVELCGPAEAKVGQDVTFQLTAADPAGRFMDSGCAEPTVSFGEGDQHAICTVGCVPPDPPQPKKFGRSYTHTYTKPGTYEVVGSVVSCGNDAGDGTARVTITITQ